MGLFLISEFGELNVKCGKFQILVFYTIDIQLPKNHLLIKFAKRQKAGTITPILPRPSGAIPI